MEPPLAPAGHRGVVEAAPAAEAEAEAEAEAVNPGRSCLAPSRRSLEGPPLAARSATRLLVPRRTKSVPRNLHTLRAAGQVALQATGRDRAPSAVEDAAVEPEPTGFGQRRLTLIDSLSLNWNNILGPGIVLLPLLNQARRERASASP